MGARLSTETTEVPKSIHSIKKFNNDGRNYSMWAARCCMILDTLDMWDVVNPNAQISVRTPPLLSSGKPPGSPASDSTVDWNRKNDKPLSYVGHSIGRYQHKGRSLPTHPPLF